MQCGSGLGREERSFPIVIKSITELLSYIKAKKNGNYLVLWDVDDTLLSHKRTAYTEKSIEAINAVFESHPPTQEDSESLSISHILLSVGTTTDCFEAQSENHCTPLLKHLQHRFGIASSDTKCAEDWLVHTGTSTFCLSDVKGISVRPHAIRPSQIALFLPKSTKLDIAQAIAQLHNFDEVFFVDNQLMQVGVLLPVSSLVPNDAYWDPWFQQADCQEKHPEYEVSSAELFSTSFYHIMTSHYNLTPVHLRVSSEHSVLPTEDGITDEQYAALQKNYEYFHEYLKTAPEDMITKQAEYKIGIAGGSPVSPKTLSSYERVKVLEKFRGDVLLARAQIVGIYVLLKKGTTTPEQRTVLRERCGTAHTTLDSLQVIDGSTQTVKSGIFSLESCEGGQAWPPHLMQELKNSADTWATQLSQRYPSILSNFVIDWKDTSTCADFILPDLDEELEPSSGATCDEQKEGQSKCTLQPNNTEKCKPTAAAAVTAAPPPPPSKLPPPPVFKPSAPVVTKVNPTMDAHFQAIATLEDKDLDDSVVEIAGKALEKAPPTPSGWKPPPLVEMKKVEIANDWKRGSDGKWLKPEDEPDFEKVEAVYRPHSVQQLSKGWENAESLSRPSEGESNCVFFVDFNDGTRRVVKTSSTAPQARYAYEVCQTLGLSDFIPKESLHYWPTDSWRIIKKKVKSLSDDMNSRMTHSALMRPQLVVQEFIPGWSVQQHWGLTDAMGAAEALKVHPQNTESGSKLIGFGKILAVNAIINNWDSVVCGDLWGHSGNLTNIIIANSDILKLRETLLKNENDTKDKEKRKQIYQSNYTNNQTGWCTGEAFLLDCCCTTINPNLNAKEFGRYNAALFRFVQSVYATKKGDQQQQHESDKDNKQDFILSALHCLVGEHNVPLLGENAVPLVAQGCREVFDKLVAIGTAGMVELKQKVLGQIPRENDWGDIWKNGCNAIHNEYLAQVVDTVIAAKM